MHYLSGEIMSVLTHTQAVQQNIHDVEKMYVKLSKMRSDMQVVMFNVSSSDDVSRPHIMINGEDAESLMTSIADLLFNSAQLLKTIHTPLQTIKEQVRKELIEELRMQHSARGELIEKLKGAK